MPDATTPNETQRTMLDMPEKITLTPQQAATASAGLVTVLKDGQNLDERIAAFVKGAQEKIEAHFKASYPNLSVPVLSIDPKGLRYARIVRKDHPGDKHGSVFAFID